MSGVTSGAAGEAVRPAAWPAYPFQLDSYGEWEPSEQWLLAVGPAVKLLLHALRPALSPDHPIASLASPTVKSVASTLRANGLGQSADEFLARWRTLFEGQPGLSDMFHCLLKDAAAEIAFPQCPMFDDHSLDDPQLDRVVDAFKHIPEFATRLEEVYKFARSVVDVGSVQASPAHILACGGPDGPTGVADTPASDATALLSSTSGAPKSGAFRYVDSSADVGSRLPAKTAAPHSDVVE